MSACPRRYPASPQASQTVMTAFLSSTWHYPVITPTWHYDELFTTDRLRDLKALWRSLPKKGNHVLPEIKRGTSDLFRKERM